MNEPRELWEQWNRVLKKSSRGEGMLDEREQTVFLANRFICDAELCGLSGALYNVSPAVGGKWLDLRATSVAFRVIGCSAASEMLTEIACFLETSAITEPMTWNERLDSAVSEEKLAEFDASLEAAIPELWRSLERYTRSNFTLKSDA